MFIGNSDIKMLEIQFIEVYVLQSSSTNDSLLSTSKRTEIVTECIYPTPLPWTGCGTRSVFKLSKTDLIQHFPSLRQVA